MWRCKWTELRIKEFVSQAVKCDREISALDQRKHMGLDQFAVEGFGSRSLPYTFQGHRKKVMKRRKRKRVEDTIDPKSYMSNHSLFSYIGTTPLYLCIMVWVLCSFILAILMFSLSGIWPFAGNKRSDPDGTSIADDLCNSGKILFTNQCRKLHKGLKNLEYWVSLISLSLAFLLLCVLNILLRSIKEMTSSH